MARVVRPSLLALVPLLLAGQDPLADLSQLLDTPVVSASRQERKASESPGVIAVLSGRDLRRRGFRSVAEALATLPGMYGIDDHLNLDLGLRGFRGGIRNANRIFKVMVDNQPVAFRPDGTVSLGPDFLPLGAIERIEVLRGPASALYGANAFLGVIHILTRHAGGTLQGQGQVRAQRERGDVGWSGEGTLLGGTPEFGGLATFSLGRLDRSGHAIPAGSPVLRSNTVPQVEAQEAWSRPASLFLKGRWTPGPSWTHEVSWQDSRQRTVAEWLDFGILSHDNRVGQAVGTLGWRSVWTPAQGLQMRFQGGTSHSRPWRERLSTGSSLVRPRRELATRGLDLSAEGQWAFRPGSWLVGGLDLTRDDHDLMALFAVNTATGAEQRVYPSQGERVFRNLGAYLQVGLRPLARTELTLHLRRDDHNLYGEVHTWRAGLVMTPTEDVSLKLLAGTSFKAPSPLQLFALPIYPGDLVGNASLRPERARTLEFSAEVRTPGGLQLRETLFHTRIADLIDLAPFNTNLLPVNRDEGITTGLESELLLLRRGWDLSLGLTLVDARVLRREPLKPEVREPSSGFPRVSGHLRASVVLPEPLRGSLDVAVRHGSSRRSTAINTFENHFTPYALHPVTLVDVGWFLPVGLHTLHLQVRNLLDRTWAEPGSRGYDLPGARREWSVTFTSRF